MEYGGYATDWDEVVFRGEVAAHEFVAFWLRDRRLVAGLNMNVWDASEPIRALIRSQRALDPRDLADPAIPLSGLVEKARGAATEALECQGFGGWGALSRFPALAGLA